MTSRPRPVAWRSGTTGTSWISESRHEMIRVRLNGKLAAESPGVEGRPLKGPVGLQLHDQFSFVLFRNIRIRVIR